MRQFMGQDLAALESCFETRDAFHSFAKQNFKWDKTTCYLYIGYYMFLVDYPIFVYSGLSWTMLRNEWARIRKWLDSADSKTLHGSDYTSSSFWKGDLPLYREIFSDAEDSEYQNTLRSVDSLASLATIAVESQMVLSVDLNNLNLH